MSALAPLVACLVLAWGALIVGGNDVSSTTIQVMEGPAERAGLRDGDRIVAIDGVPMNSWDAIRATAKPGRGPAHVDVERAGARRGFVIEPGPEGRLGLATQRRNQAVSVGAALRQALAIPANAYSSALTGIGRAATERSELGGPVALVRASGDQTNSTATIQFLMFYGV